MTVYKKTYQNAHDSRTYPFIQEGTVYGTKVWINEKQCLFEEIDNYCKIVPALKVATKEEERLFYTIIKLNRL